MGKLQVVSAVSLTQDRWNFGQPLPDKMEDGKTLRFPTSVIDKLILVDNYVEVSGRWTDKPGKHIHQVLLPPSISLVLSFAPNRVDWEELLSELADEEPLDEVVDVLGGIWQLGATFPGDTENTSTIAAMYAVGDKVEVFVLPNPGTELDRSHSALHATLMPLTILRTSALGLSFAQCSRIMSEAQEAADAPDPDDDDTEEPEEDAPPPAAAAPRPNGLSGAIAAAMSESPAAAAPTVPNGTGSTTSS